jgi:hypothetical protein
MIVCLKIDPRDRALTKSTRGLQCIVLEEHSNHVKGIRVATRWGVVAGHLKDTKRYLAPDQYIRLEADTTTVLQPELNTLSLSGEFSSSIFTLE